MNSADDTLVEPGVPDETEEHQRHPTGGEHDERRDGISSPLPDDDDGDTNDHCRDQPDASEQGQRVGQGETFPAEHDHTIEGDRFAKIAVLTDGYTPPADACNTYRVTLAMLEEFENDLHRHIHLENNVLFPKAIALEKKLQERNA